MSATNRYLDNIICKDKNSWSSVDDHCQNCAVMMLPANLPIRAANTMAMLYSNWVTRQLPCWQEHTLLMLRWRSFSRYDRKCPLILCANTGGHYFGYIQQWPSQVLITRLIWSKIVDVLLTLTLPQAYLWYSTIWFGVVYHSQCSGSQSTIMIAFSLMTSLFWY
jgi:hypothetical protein